MLASIDTDELRSLIVVARSGEIVRAAQELEVTTQHLMQVARKCERQIGVPLFVWQDTQVGLTQSGRVFVEGAKLALYLLLRTVEQIDAPGFALRHLSVPPPLPPLEMASRHDPAVGARHPLAMH
jgi:DNA-binding transcriptional LysR family regulator